MCEQRLERNLRRLLQPRQQDVARRGAELCPERRRHEHAVARLEPVKPPEPLVDAVDEHARRPPVRGLVGDEPASGNQRRRSRAVGGQIRRERLPEEAHRRDDLTSPAEPRQHQIAQAAAHRVADQQRAPEHRHRGGDAERDGDVGAPVVGGATDDEVVHVDIRQSQHPRLPIPNSAGSTDRLPTPNPTIFQTLH